MASFKRVSNSLSHYCLLALLDIESKLESALSFCSKKRDLWSTISPSLGEGCALQVFPRALTPLCNLFLRDFLLSLLKEALLRSDLILVLRDLFSVWEEHFALFEKCYFFVFVLLVWKNPFFEAHT